MSTLIICADVVLCWKMSTLIICADVVLYIVTWEGVWDPDGQAEEGQ